ncbi:MAG: patatin-like phospholipase family protein [Acidobacteriia bacterium]|nr:patatin-like phospholipase family protein [Terriglobia bacterium]
MQLTLKTKTCAVVVLLGLALGGAARGQEPAPNPAPNPAAGAVPPAPAAAETLKPKARPKIGLALEGGGALGMAHIGVLEWFEKHHIPVDYIAGTSMGGLVGGFYAAGKSPEELRELVSSTDWDQVFETQMAYGDLSFRRKEDQRAYPNAMVLGLRHGASLPPALNSGHNGGLVIARETIAYSRVTNYDTLPTPFRCVATELASGKKVVFPDDDPLPLGEALRATSALPGVLNPVLSGDRIYVDGGLVDNLPADVARKMGADIVIAVHLDTKDPDAKKLQSLVQVMDRSADIMVDENERHGLASADLVIRVDLGERISTVYEKIGEIIGLGVQAAEAKAPLLAPYALDDAAWDEYVKQREARKVRSVPAPQFIEVQGTSAEAARAIEHSLRKHIGRPLDEKKIAADLTQLTGLGRFDRAGYRLTERNGRPGLLIDMEEKNYAPPTLQPGLELSGSQAGDVSFTLGTRLTFQGLGGYRSEWRTDFLLGSQYGLYTEYYHPLTAGSRWFLSLNAGGSNAALKIYAQNDPQAEYRVNRAETAADLGYAFNRFNELRVGYEGGYYSDKLRSGTPLLPAVNEDWRGARVRFRTDWTDSPVIPRRGVRADMNFHWYKKAPGSAGNFPSLELRTGLFAPATKKTSFFLLSSGGTTFGYEQTGLPQFFLGGPERLGAYGLNEMRGNQYFLFQAGYMRSLITLPRFVARKLYFTVQYEIGKVNGATSTGAPLPRLPDDMSAGFLAETVFGPIFIGGSYGDTGHQKWFFRLGRVF